MIAVLEAAKASLVLMAGVGLLTLIHRDIHFIAARVIEHMHLNPANHYPRIFLDAATRMTDARLWLLAGLAFTYSIVRGVQAYGLWQGRTWAEWLGVLTGTIYLPIEIYELNMGVTPLKSVALLVNLLVVGYLGFTLQYAKQVQRLASGDINARAAIKE